MDGDIMTFATLIGSVIVLTGGCAAAVQRMMHKDRLAILSGGLAFPSVLLLGLIYWLLTMEVDDAPPGMVILGSLMAAAIAAPITFLVSFATVLLLARRTRLSDS
jgi:vacuolar-type H+-ATPase subunit I/STV1